MRGVHKKSPLSASGLESFTAFAYNSAPRTNACRLLNRYANQYIAVLPVVMLALLVIIRGFPYRALVYFVFRRITTGFYRNRRSAIYRAACCTADDSRDVNTRVRQDENA